MDKVAAIDEVKLLSLLKDAGLPIGKDNRLTTLRDALAASKRVQESW